MKKVLSMGVMLLLALTTLLAGAGCNPDNGKIKIELGMWPQPALQDDVAMYRVWKENFERDYPQYEIVPSPFTYDPGTIDARIGAGTVPTIFQTYFTEPERLISNNWVRPITEQLNELGWTDKMDESMKAGLTRGNDIYGVPRDGYGLGLFINMEMAADVGLITKYPDDYFQEDLRGKYNLYKADGTPAYPTTFDEMEEWAEQIIERSAPGTRGFVILSAARQGGWQFSNLAWNFGLEAFQTQDADGKWASHLNAPEAVEALTWIKNVREKGLIIEDTAIQYNVWYEKIVQRQIGMAFAGSDAIANPVNNSSGQDKFNKDNIAFVPMPSIESVKEAGEAKALFGGTPFVVRADATDEQTMGALRFLEYMGRSPEVSEVSVQAMRDGHNTAQKKGMPILPSIRPWVNEDYVEMVAELDDMYINVDIRYYQDFFDSIDTMRRAEEPNFCQAMYECLDNAIQSVLANATNANPTARLNEQNNNFFKILNALNTGK